MNELFFALIRIALGTQTCLPHTPSSEEWKELYRMAKKQSLLGICFAGVQRLQSQQQCPPEEVYDRWMGMSATIQMRNKVVDRQCVEMQQRIEAEGLKACILKGQGVALLYDVHLRNLRQSGDIDIWVKGGFDVVNEFVQRTAPSDDIAYHRFHYDVFKDTEVELHHRPTLMRNLFDNKKLQKWCENFSSENFVRHDAGFCVPPLSFNRIFILTHIYRHFLFEGIGMRQIMDYYFVLKQEPVDKDEIQGLLKEFRLTRFAGALMWVMKYLFGIEDKYMICQPDEKEGHFILEEIMQTGNFGKGDTRYREKRRLERMTRKRLHLISHYPSEVIWTPIWLIYHKAWKWNKKRIINE